MKSLQLSLTMKHESSDKLVKCKQANCLARLSIILCGGKTASTIALSMEVGLLILMDVYNTVWVIIYCLLVSSK